MSRTFDSGHRCDFASFLGVDDGVLLLTRTNGGKSLRNADN